MNFVSFFSVILTSFFTVIIVFNCDVVFDITQRICQYFTYRYYNHKYNIKKIYTPEHNVGDIIVINNIHLLITRIDKNNNCYHVLNVENDACIRTFIIYYPYKNNLFSALDNKMFFQLLTIQPTSSIYHVCFKAHYVNLITGNTFESSHFIYHYKINTIIFITSLLCLLFLINYISFKLI